MCYSFKLRMVLKIALAAAVLSSSTAAFAALPKVLLIGDSICGGYIPYVADLLDGIAQVSGPTGGVDSDPYYWGSTHSGVPNTRVWVEGKNFDIIHFNFGLHDLEDYSKGYCVPLGENAGQYQYNLQQIVTTFKTYAPSARLIWANTTPVPAGASHGRRQGDDQIFNAAAPYGYARNGVAVDDLNTLATQLRADPSGIYLYNPSGTPLPNDVHYSAMGYQMLAGQVSAPRFRPHMPRNRVQRCYRL